MSPADLLPVDAEACAAVPILRLIGEKWSLLVLGLLAERPHGFNELDRAVDGLSRRMLTRTLGTLTGHSLVDRAEPPRPGGRAVYSLTGDGRELLEMVRVIGEWAHATRPRTPRSAGSR